MPFNPYATEKCPSCGLGLDEITCEECGLNYQLYNHAGIQNVCPGCNVKSSLKHYGNGDYGKLELNQPENNNPGSDDDDGADEPTYCIDYPVGETEPEDEEPEPEEEKMNVETWIETSITTEITTELIPCTELHYITMVITEVISDCTELHYGSIIRYGTTVMDDGTHMGTNMGAQVESWIETYLEACPHTQIITKMETELIDCTDFSVITVISTHIETWIESNVPEYPDDTEGPEKTSVPVDTEVPEGDPTQSTDCPCDDPDNQPPGEAQGDNACVHFSISFGRILSLPGLAIGKLTLYSSMLDGKLATAAGLKYEHLIERKLYAIEGQDKIGSPSDGFGVKVSVGGGGKGCGNSTQSLVGNSYASSSNKMLGSYNSKNLMRASVDQESGNIRYLEEVLQDGTILKFDRNSGTIDTIQMPDGKTADRRQLDSELKIIRAKRYAPDASVLARTPDGHILASKRSDEAFIRQIWNRSDGLLDITSHSPDSKGCYSYQIHWYTADNILGFDQNTQLYQIRPGAIPVKTWEVKSQLAHYHTAKTGGALGETYSYPSGETYPSNTSERLLSMVNPQYQQAKTSLKYLEIIEKRDGYSYPMRWEQPNLTTLIYKRGTGNDAEVCIKNRSGSYKGQPIDNTSGDSSGMLALTYPSGSGKAGNQVYSSYKGGNPAKADGYKLSVNGSPADEIIDIKYYYKGEGPYLPYNAQRATRTIYKRYAFGDVVVCQEEGYGTPYCRRTIYIHDTNKNSPTYGQKIGTIKPDGTEITYKYDKQGRLIRTTKPWPGGGMQVTRCTWCNTRPNDRRLASVNTWIEQPRIKILLRGKTIQYEENNNSRRETVTITGLGIDHPQTTIREWFGADPENNGQTCQWAASRPKLVQQPNGAQTIYSYENSNSYGATYRTLIMEGENGQPVPGKTRLRIDYINHKGQKIAYEHYVHMTQHADIEGMQWHNNFFKLINRETYELDAAGRPVSVTDLAGNMRTYEWFCKGLLSQTNEHGIKTTYNYNDAKQLVRYDTQTINWNQHE